MINLLTFGWCITLIIVFGVSTLLFALSYFDNTINTQKVSLIISSILLCIFVIIFIFGFDKDPEDDGYEYEIERGTLATLDYTKDSNPYGVFILGFGWAESDKTETFTCYVSDRPNEYKLEHFDTRYYKLRLDDSTEPKLVYVYNHKYIIKALFPFCRDTANEILIRKVLVVPSNTIKSHYDGNIK
jgi:energy-coupling factor transporter transmembrane protein EcfT